MRFHVDQEFHNHAKQTITVLKNKNTQNTINKQTNTMKPINLSLPAHNYE